MHVHKYQSIRRGKQRKLYAVTYPAYVLELRNFEYHKSSCARQKITTSFQVYNWGCCWTTMPFHFRSLDSISSKLRPFVSGTLRITNTRANNDIAPNRKKTFAGPRNSCSKNEKHW
jgi:hypothetical protein